MNRQHSMEQDPKIQTKSKHVDFQDEKNNSTRQKKTKNKKERQRTKQKERPKMARVLFSSLPTIMKMIRLIFQKN